MFPDPDTAEANVDAAHNAVSLTGIRRKLTAASDARICLGGRTEGSSGRCAGIVEEAHMSLKAGQPLYASEIFGGASAQLIAPLPGGLEMLSEANALSIEENERLFKASHLSEVIGWVPTGLGRKRRTPLNS